MGRSKVSIWRRLFGPRREEIDAWWDDEDGTFDPREEDCVPDPYQPADMVHHHRIHLHDLTRRLLYDAGYPQPEQAMGAIEAAPQSEDVAEMSRHDSDVRLRNVLAVAPVAAVMCDALSSAMASHDLKKSGSSGVDLEAISERARHLRGAALAVLSNLADMGAIAVSTHITMGVTDDE